MPIDLKAKVIESAGDSKKMWNTACTATARQFFADKVARIQQETSEITQTMNQSRFQTPRPYTGSPLVAFPDVSSADVLKVLSSLPNKSSPRDILPTLLLKSCADVFAPLIAHLTNCSFSEGTFPTLFKAVQVLPLLINQT